MARGRAVRAAFEMLDTPSGVAFDAVELPLQPIDPHAGTGPYGSSRLLSLTDPCIDRVVDKTIPACSVSYDD